MRKFLIFILLVSCSVSFYGQTTNLSKMTSEQRNKYLVDMAKDVISRFGPEYYRDYKEPEISDVKIFLDSTYRHPEIIRKLGKKYYTVTFFYDKEIELLAWDYAAMVDIWEENGEPKEVLFGNNIGIDFSSQPYRKWLEKGVKDDDKIPYQPFLLPESLRKKLKSNK